MNSNILENLNPSGVNSFAPEGIYCAPQEKLSERIKTELTNINANKKNEDFSSYLKKIEHLFQIEKSTKSVTEEKKFFFGGIIVGEGSFNISAKKQNHAPFGVMLDPEFSVTQHVNGVSLLSSALHIFRTGVIRYKSKSNATLVFRIDNRVSLLETVIPYCEKYCQPHSSLEWKRRKSQFKELLLLFEQGQHKDLAGFKDKMLPIWDKMRKQKNQSNSAFSSLEEAIEFVMITKKKKESSETTRDLIYKG